ncbi:MAG TPA: DEAD/DEAH box helicase [Ktedonobacterales bacterium]|jgi:ATP-dependent RNA helicase DeaD
MHVPALGGSTAVLQPQRTPSLNTQAFLTLGLGETALQAVVDLGYTAPTPIQEQAIPLLLAGGDLIAQAPTGTGKTAAYGLPIVEQLNDREQRPQFLVVTPTRELAIQVAEAFHHLGKYRALRAVPIYGGAPYDRQLHALKRGVQVVVGTPGRLLDHLRRKTLDLTGVRMVVLDEADEMLHMGFLEDIEALLAALPSRHQTALFSATIPAPIANLAEQYLQHPTRVNLAVWEAVAPLVRQVYYEVPGPAKSEALTRLLDMEEPESAIIFVRTRREADQLAEQLNTVGYLAQTLHGEITQAQRERTLDRFRSGQTQVLVATDVAARGLDIPEVSHIINYDMPLDAESYVHRIGRTGRAGATGLALTLVTLRERRLLLLIERAIHRKLERLPLPTVGEVHRKRREAFREEVLRTLKRGELAQFRALVEELATTHDQLDIAAAAFKLVAEAREAKHPGWNQMWLTPVKEAAVIPSLPVSVTASGKPAPRLPTSRQHQYSREAPSPLARLFLRIGKRDGVRPADIVGAIANTAGISGQSIGAIDIFETSSFVEVPEAVLEDVRATLNRTTIRGQAPQATPARPKDGRHAQKRQAQRVERQDKRVLRVKSGRGAKTAREAHSPERSSGVKSTRRSKKGQ